MNTVLEITCVSIVCSIVHVHIMLYTLTSQHILADHEHEYAL